MEQKQEVGVRVARIIATKRINSNLLDQYKHDNYNIDDSQDSESNIVADPDEIEDLNIG